MSGFYRSMITATGAYGREVTEASWEGGLDFKIVHGGPYFSIRDTKVLVADGIDCINFVNKHGYTVFVKNI